MVRLWCKNSPLDSFYERAGAFLRDFDKSNHPKINPTEKLEAEESGLFDSLGKKELKDLARRQHEVLSRIFGHPMSIANVVATHPSSNEKKGRVTLAHQGRTIDVSWPKDLPLKVGQAVRINNQTLQIIEPVGDIGVGAVAKIRTVRDELRSEVELNGSSRVVLNGLVDIDKLHEGDRVVLDASSSVMVWWLGASDRLYKLGKIPTVTWDDIGGLADAKRELMEAIVLPITAAEYFRHYNKKPMSGVLIFGPPGCGKTMLFEACATEIAQQNGMETLESGYILLRGPDIMSEFVSIADQRLRAAFALGRQHKRKYGWRAILAIDEAEAIFKKRGTGVSSDATDSVVQTFLGETNGMQEDNPLILLASNRPDILDPAVVRNKRIDRHVKVGRPDRESSQDIAYRLLKNIPLQGAGPEETARYVVDEFFSPKYALLDIDLESGEKTQFSLADIVSGAMIDGVIDKATSVAIERDRNAKKVSGLTKDDIRIGLGRAFAQVKDLDHSEAFKTFVQDLKGVIKNIKPLRQALLP